MKALFLRNIKQGFATNSSSYHSTLIMTEDEYDKWKSGEIESIDDYTYEEWNEDEYAETDWNSYTTPKGEKIVVLCKHGNDW